MASAARHQHAFPHQGNGTPPANWGSTEVGVPGRRPSSAPQGATALRRAAQKMQSVAPRKRIACAAPLRRPGATEITFVASNQYPRTATR